MNRFFLVALSPFFLSCYSDSSVNEFPYPKGDNPLNCVLNTELCPSQGLICDTQTKRCAPGMGRCRTTIDCQEAAKPVCRDGNCVPCDTTTPSTGDMQCGEWSMSRSNQSKLCIASACKECRNNTNCTQPGKNFCDQTRNMCSGCTKDADCSSAGSMICKLDESVLGTGDPLSKIGECVDIKDVAYAKNLTGSCSDTAADAGSMGNPYCQIQTAVNKGKSYIRVLGGGMDFDPLLVNAGPQQRVIIYGPGQSSANIRSASVSNGAWLTLLDMGVKPPGGVTAIQCDTGSRLTVRRIQVSGATIAAGGIRADQCAKATIERTKIDQISGHGIWISGGSEHRVVNTAIIRSGNSTVRAALRVGQGVTNSIFAFNTITGGNIEGALCEAGQTITDSIVQGNLTVQVSGCNMVRVITMGAMITDVSMSGGDPRVTGDSTTMPVVVDKGMQLPVPAPPVTEDFFGNPRPAGSGLDIGFHEYR